MAGCDGYVRLEGHISLGTIGNYNLMGASI
jgi:hypothetical protein